MAATGSKSAIAASQPAARNSMFPEGYLKVVGFFEQPDREWYEGVHAPDFLSFAKPHMARYARNWMKGVRFGEKPGFDVITEIQFAGESDKAAVRAAMATPAAAPLLEHTMEQRAKRGIVDELPPPGLGLFPVTPVREDVGPFAPLASRQALLLRRATGSERDGFDAAVRAIAEEIAGQGSDISVSLDVLAADDGPSPAEAVICIGNGEGKNLAFADRAGVELVSLLEVETQVSAVGTGHAG